MATQVEQFGKYLLLEKVAAGGMAEVYLAKTAGAVGVNKFVAIKRILPQYSGHQEFVEMFKEEAKICVNLNHSNVVSIFDFGIEKESFFLVMEFVPGKNLRQVINELKKLNKSFTIEQIVFVIKEVAAGLDHAHRCVDTATGRPLNITHRDMSPQNIMLSYEGEIKVIDFGIAKAETQLEATKAGTLKGKFGYMSPEQAEGFPIDPRTDVFALGIVLWELLANDRLFTASNEAAILRKIRDCQIPSIRKINPGVPPELERIVNKALAKDKNLRYQTAANLHRDLNRFLNTQYPDFSPHDFSVFVKDCFSQHYIDQRNKMVEFAKIQFSNDKTSVTATATITEKTEDKKADLDVTSTQEDIRKPGENILELSTDTNHKVNLNDLRDNLTVTRKRGNVIIPRPLSHTTTNATPNPNTNITGYTGAGVSKATNANIPNPNSRPKINSIPQPPRSSAALDTITDLLTKSVIGLILVFSGFYLYKNVLSEPIKQFLKTGTIEVASKKPTTDPIMNPSGLGFTIYSEPPSVGVGDQAKIFINGVDTNLTTPSRITVEGNKEFTVRIERPGFVPYEKIHKVTAEGQSLTATLQSEKELAKITIVLDGATDGEVVYVNGVRLKEKLPIRGYTIQPYTDVIVRVVNPFTKQSDQVVVNVKPGDDKLVNMKFGIVRK